MMQGCLDFMRRTLSGNEFAPRSLKGSLNFRTSSLLVKRTLMVISVSGDDAWEFAAMIDDLGTMTNDGVEPGGPVNVKILRDSKLMSGEAY